MNVRSKTPDQPVRWVPIKDLPPLACVFLGDDLGGREVVPAHVADRVTALSAEWENEGFTEQTVQPWIGLPAPLAGALVRLGVAPAMLDVQVTDLPGGIVAGSGPMTVRQAVIAGLLSAEQVAGLVAQAPEGSPGETGPAQVVPAVFSHPVDEFDHSPRRSSPQPSGSPFDPGSAG
jgi:hypothetical protein